MHDISEIETASGSLMTYCERANITIDMSIRSVLDEVNNTIRLIDESNERLTVLNSEMDSLASQGLSMEVLEEITDQLRELEYPINVRSGEDVNRLLLTIDQNIKDSTTTLDNYRKELSELQCALAESLESTDPEKQDLENNLSQLSERLTETEIIRKNLEHFSLLFPWPAEKPLTELVVEVKSIRKVAGELQTAIGKEKIAKANYADSAKKKEQLKKELAALLPRIDKLSKAHSVFESLQKEHSLNSAMTIALGKNRTAIETIFSQIHSPNEFRGLGSTWLTLIRKVDRKTVKLSEISSGQRAAFALSVFLAQNAKLKMAPPVVIMDDPIAHIDDMNSLSFLDYLREVALKGQRQIFFATTNDKLVALVKRKFDFLGPDEFRSFKLTRSA